MLYLKELNKEDIVKEYEFTKKMKTENGFENPYSESSFEEFSTTIYEKRINNSKGIDLEPNHVPDTYYYLWDDDKIVGLFKVRHYLTDGLRNGGGHIGYGILEEYRSKGYATTGLKLAINKLIALPDFNEEEVYMSVNIDNPASLKVMLNNGAYIHHSDELEHYTRIKVNK